MTPDEERLAKIEKLRKDFRTTRAHAASIVDAEEAAKNREPPTPEQIKAAKDAMLTHEARESQVIARLAAEQAAGQQPSTMEGAQ